MAVTDKLSSVLKIRNTIPNVELAKQIADKNDKQAVTELVENLSDKFIQSDCIKVLYEIGELKPELIADHIKVFLDLLNSKNNRLQWGAMTAIDTITLLKPKLVYAALSKIVDLADKGSVITRDHAINILVKLGTQKEYSKDALTLLIEQLLNSPTNQLPRYAELSILLVNDSNKTLFIKTLSSRIKDFEKGTKLKRLEKVIGKLSRAR